MSGQDARSAASIRSAIGVGLPIRDRVEAKRQYDALIVENERLREVAEEVIEATDLHEWGEAAKKARAILGR